MKLSAILPSGSGVTWKSGVRYQWAAAALNSDGGSYLISSHVKKESATRAARAFSNRERGSLGGWRGVVIRIEIA